MHLFVIVDSCTELKQLAEVAFLSGSFVMWNNLNAQTSQRAEVNAVSRLKVLSLSIKI
jgi:hypothetical protein